MLKANLGNPPNSHSAQMKGPGLKMTRRSSSLAISRKSVTFKKGEKSLSPLPKSKTFVSGS